MEAPDLPGVTLVRRIDAERRPGAGFHLAVQVADGADVVVRTYARAVRSKRDRLRFEQEVAGLKALADLPGVLPVLAAGVSGAGVAYVITPYCPAGSLRDHTASVGRLAAVEVRRIGDKVSGALAMVHARGIVHRNIRPSSILIDRSGEPALSAFGLAAIEVAGGAFAPPETHEDPFQAPEAFLPELITPVSDVYSLGATLYRLLSGGSGTAQRAPTQSWAGDTLIDLPYAPTTLMGTLRRAMAIDPDDRISTSDELHDALTGPGSELVRR